MTIPAHPSDRPPFAGTSRPLGVPMIGYAFMGKAHSNAWRNVASFFDVPAFEQKVLVGRDAAGVQKLPRSTAGRRPPRTGVPSWTATTSTSWISARRAGCTPRSPPPPSKPASTCCVEKPLANTLAEAEAMTTAAQAARTRGVQSMVGFNYRRVPALALARELIAEGRVGTVRHVRAAYLQDWLADSESPMTWRLTKETAGSGALGDIASHAIDQVLFLLGDSVTEVSGRTHTFTTRRPGATGLEDVTVDDAAWATLSLASGAIASVEASRVATGQKNSLQLEIYGDQGLHPLRPGKPERTALPGRHRTRPRTGLPPDPRQRTRAPLPGSLVAAGPHHRLGAHLHPRDPRLPPRGRRRNPAIAVVRRRPGGPADPERHRGIRRREKLHHPPRPAPTPRRPRHRP